MSDVAATTATTTAFRTPTSAELDALDAIHAAYYACNAADGRLAFEGAENQAMTHLARAARTGIAQAIGNSAAAPAVWDAAIRGGENISYCIFLLLRGQLDY